MWILCLAEDSLETSSLILSEKQEKIFMNVICCSRDWRFKGLQLLKCQGLTTLKVPQRKYLNLQTE